jgi:O-antigen/teichoic acid export membrane protein
MATLLIVGATSFFELAYDHRYAQAGVFLPILAVGVWFGCLENMYGAAFLATGHSRWVAIGGAVKLFCFAALLVPLIVWDWGLTGAAVVVASCEMVRAMVNQYLGRQLGLRNLRIESAMLFLLLMASGSGLLVMEHVPLVAEQHPSIRLLILGALVTLLFSPVLVRVGSPILRYRAGKNEATLASLSTPPP